MILIQRGANIHKARKSDGVTPFYISVLVRGADHVGWRCSVARSQNSQKNHLDVAAKLIACGANVNGEKGDSHPPLYAAARVSSYPTPTPPNDPLISNRMAATKCVYC